MKWIKSGMNKKAEDNVEYILTNYNVDTYEDVYEEGEGEAGSSWSGKDLGIVNLRANSIKELIDKVKYADYSFSESDNLSYMEYGNRFVMDALVNADNEPASKTEIEQWKKGEMKLWSAQASFTIEKILGQVPIEAEDVKALGIEFV